MSEMLQVIALMAVPACYFATIRWLIARQNRKAPQALGRPPASP